MNDLGGNAAVAPAAERLDAIFRQWNALVEALPIGVYVCAPDGRVTNYNRRAVELWGRAPAGGDLFGGALRVRDPQGDALARDEGPMGEVLRTGIGVRGRGVVVERADGGDLNVVVNVEPLRDEAGVLIGAVSCFQDITHVKRIEARAGQVDNWVRSVVARSPVAMCVTDAEGRVASFNPAAERLWGRTPVLGKDRWCGSHLLYHPDGRPMPLDACPMATALKTGEAVQGLEVVFERPDGSRGAFLAYPTLLRDRAGALLGAVNMLVDISERKLAEDRQRVLIDELNHRVKNTLASVQSLAAHSLRGDVDPERMRERFENRLVALSNAHNQLATRRWRDADLAALARDVLAPYQADYRLRLDGDQVTVPARIAVTLSLVLHELATNAAKYGALSAPSGEVAVAWRRETPDRLVVEWREAGGPRVEPPARQGFGTRFIAGAVTAELGGRIDHTFDPDGVCCRIEATLQDASGDLTGGLNGG